MISRLATPPKPGESHSAFMARCIADGGNEQACEMLWNGTQGISDGLPPKGISLRPDPFAMREAAMTSLARAALSAARSVREPFSKSPWPHDRAAELLTRSAVVPTTLADMAAMRTVALHFVASLTPVSAAAAVIARSLQLDFDHAAQISVPTLTLPNAAWIGEGAPIPVVQGVSAAGALVDPHKLAMITSLSGEMIRGSNAEAFVRQVLLENVGPTLDAALFSANAAVPGVSPAGVLNGVPGLTPTAGGGLDALVADVQAIAKALAPAAGASQPLLIAAPAQAVALVMRTPGGSLPWLVLASAALPDKTLIGLVPAALATSVEPPRIEASSATAHMDTAPSDISTAPGVAAAPVRSFFQIDAVALRLILPATWTRRSASGVAWLSNVTW